MATLERDLYNAFAKATIGTKTEQGKSVKEQTGGDDGNLKELSKDIATSIIDWMLKQTFTITEMKASTELENFKTLAPGAIEATVLPGINVATSGGPGATVAPGNALTKPIDLSKGIMMTFGHTYIGRPAMRVKDADTTDEWNDYTKVKLDPYKLRDQGTQQYPVDDRDEPEEEEAVELIAPTANFVVDSITFIMVPTLKYFVEFDDISTPGDGLLDSALNEWDTGDGNITEGGAPLQYTYDVDGDYTVKLTVTDTNDLSSDYSMDITIDPPEDPIASFEVGPIEGLVVSFTDTSAPGDGPINEWNWNFGNGDTSPNQSPTYEYAEAGTYEVTLTVTDIYDLSNTTEPGITITVP